MESTLVNRKSSTKKKTVYEIGEHDTSPSKTENNHQHFEVLDKEPLESESDYQGGVKFSSIKPKQGAEQKAINVTIMLLANPRAGSQMAGRFLTDYPQETVKLVVQGDLLISQHTLLIQITRISYIQILIYDVTDRDDKKLYFTLLETLSPQATPQNQVLVTIMGGDGSLAQTIKELRKNPLINNHINKLTFCLLPYGTGNDTGQVFGWGNQPGKWAADLETLMNCLLQAKQDQLTLWNVRVDGQLLDAHERPVRQEQSEGMLLTCYFNIGIDAEIGASKVILTYRETKKHVFIDFERTRTKFRCCNKILYGIHGVLRVFSWNRANQVVKRYINKVK